MTDPTTRRALAPGAVNTLPGRPARAMRAMRHSGDTRALKRELQQGNPYAVALLARRGLAYVRGTGIVRVRDGGAK